MQKQVDEAWAKFLAKNPDVKRVDYAVSIRGDLLNGVPSQPGDQVLELGHEDFLAHGIIVYMDTDYTVEHALKVAANSLGGTHNDGKPNRNKDSEQLRQYMEGSTMFGRSLPAWYIAQIAECTLRACLPLANKLTELGLYSGTPGEWKWSRGGAGGGEGQTPTRNGWFPNPFAPNVLAMNQPGDQSGAEYLQLALSGTAAGQIADLQSLLGDIQFARDCAQHYLDLPPDADLVRRALWTASCIAYRRVFTSGKGHLNPQTPRLRPNQNFTAALTTEQLKAHDEVLAIANKHIAHRVGELEQVMVLALLNPSPMPRAVAGVGTMGTVVGGADVAHIGLAEFLRTQAAQQRG